MRIFQTLWIVSLLLILSCVPQYRAQQRLLLDSSEEIIQSIGDIQSQVDQIQSQVDADEDTDPTNEIQDLTLSIDGSNLLIGGDGENSVDLNTASIIADLTSTIENICAADCCLCEGTAFEVSPSEAIDCPPLNTDTSNRGRCGPKFGNVRCNQNLVDYAVYCNSANGWCGDTDVYRNKQPDEDKYDFMPGSCLPVAPGRRLSDTSVPISGCGDC